MSDVDFGLAVIVVGVFVLEVRHFARQRPAREILKELRGAEPAKNVVTMATNEQRRFHGTRIEAD